MESSGHRCWVLGVRLLWLGHQGLGAWGGTVPVLMGPEMATRLPRSMRVRFWITAGQLSSSSMGLVDPPLPPHLVMRNCSFPEEMDSVSSSTSSELHEVRTESTYVATSDQGSERSSDDSASSSPLKRREHPSSSTTSSPRRKGSVIPNMLDGIDLNTEQGRLALQQQGPSIPLHSKCFRGIITQSSPSSPEPELSAGNSLKRAFSCQDEPSGAGFSQVSRNVPDESRLDHAKRFKRTADALKKCGLWEVALRSGDLMRRNQELQREIVALKKDTANFIHSVLQNAENKDLRKHFPSELLETADSAESPSDGENIFSPEQMLVQENSDTEQGRAPSVVTSGYHSGSETVSNHNAQW